MYLLLTGILLGSSSFILPYLINFLVPFFTKAKTNGEEQIEQTLIELRKQLQNVSMVDQFAAYAKLQRRITALTMQYKEKATGRQKGNNMAKTGVGFFLHVVAALCCIWFIWSHRGVPVISVPAELIWPFAPLLAFPFCHVGEVSVVVWLAIVRTSSSRILQLYKMAVK